MLNIHRLFGSGTTNKSANVITAGIFTHYGFGVGWGIKYRIPFSKQSRHSSIPVHRSLPVSRRICMGGIHRFPCFGNTQYGTHHCYLLLLLLRFLLLLLFCRRQQTVYEFVAPRSPAKIKFIQIPSSPCWDDLPTIKMPTMVYFIFVLFLFFHARCF